MVTGFANSFGMLTVSPPAAVIVLVNTAFTVTALLGIVKEALLAPAYHSMSPVTSTMFPSASLTLRLPST